MSNLFICNRNDCFQFVKDTILFGDSINSVDQAEKSDTNANENGEKISTDLILRRVPFM